MNPSETMNPKSIQQNLHEFCKNWKPQRRPDQEVLPRLLQEFKEKAKNWKQKEHLRYFELLIQAGDSGMTREEIYDQLWLRGLPRDPTEKLRQMCNRLNATLMSLSNNHLSNYQIRVYPSPDDDPDFDDLARVEVLVPTTGASLATWPLESSMGFTDPQLRIACASYDAGDYVQAIGHFDKMMQIIQNKPILTNSEIVQFLYYLAKTLLKLNWYDSLGEFLLGPYDRFSYLLQNELKAEILQIDGIRYRQQFEFASARACFERALRLLETSSESKLSAKHSQSLADACVLTTQIYLDQALCTSVDDLLIQETNLELAEQYLEQARGHYHMYWRQTNMPTHYEGRLRGTQGFLTVARSILFPQQLSENVWGEAEMNARQGFEPERVRKPFGIVAGKYALTIVWLTKGQWLLRQDTTGEARTQAIKYFEQGFDLLSKTYLEYITSGKVYLGPKYELPKIQKALITLKDELLHLDSGVRTLVNNVDFADQEDNLRTSSHICIYTPLV